MIVHVPIEHSVVQSPSDIYKIMQMVLESEHETDRNKEHFWTLAMNETKNIFNGEDGPMATLLLSIMGAFAEFERALIKERQKEGIALAKKKGIYRGRKPVLSSSQIQELKQKVAGGFKKIDLANQMGIGRHTLYKYLKKGQ